MTNRFLDAIASHRVPSCNARHFLALATLVFATLTQADPALAVEAAIPCDPEPTDTSISYSEIVSCSIDLVGDVDIFRFSGTAGDVVALLGTQVVGPGIACIQLFDPAGGSVAASCGGVSARIDATLGETGLYSILVFERFSTQTLDYTLAYQCIVGACVELTCEAADGQNLTLMDDTVLDSQSFEVCDTIEVGPNYQVAGPNGFLTLRAGNAVIFKDGASVGIDGTLIVDIDPSLKP